ncbi:MAG: hypothetical protein HY015_10485 [Bacteroidetes bacterium]|nr:hypothetical protein [Bacteroidota bacterium]MBI3483375.1 hypothetical protein [Bacteroidota bacterium]
MSVMVVKIKKKENTSVLKKIVAALNEKASVLSDEEYRDSMFSKLLEEGRKSKLLSTTQAKKELNKRGINF